MIEGWDRYKEVLGGTAALSTGAGYLYMKRKKAQSSASDEPTLKKTNAVMATNDNVTTQPNNSGDMPNSSKRDISGAPKNPRDFKQSIAQKFSNFAEDISKNSGKIMKMGTKALSQGVVGAAISYVAEETLGAGAQWAYNNGHPTVANALNAGSNAVKGVGNAMGATLTGGYGFLGGMVENTFGIDIGAKTASKWSGGMARDSIRQIGMAIMPMMLTMVVT